MASVVLSALIIIGKALRELMGDIRSGEWERVIGTGTSRGVGISPGIDTCKLADQRLKASSVWTLR